VGQYEGEKNLKGIQEGERGITQFQNPGQIKAQRSDGRGGNIRKKQK